MISSRNIIATPPGATIREQLIDKGMNQINGQVLLIPEVALRLELVLGVPATSGTTSRLYTARRSLK